MPTPRLMAVLAHPDDESLGMGGTLAKYASEDVEVFLLTATHGDKVASVAIVSRIVSIPAHWRWRTAVRVATRFSRLRFGCA